MDRRQFRSALMSRGIRVSDDDPLFIMLELNEMHFDEMVARHFGTLDQHLTSAVNDVRISVANIVAARDCINDTAANTVRALMIGDDGPVKQLDRLVRSQRDALSWISRAAKFYEQAYVLRPMFLALVLGGLFGGFAGGIVGSLVLKLG